MIVIGSMIGSGIFITSAESARLVGAPGWLLLAWGLAGLLTITGALCCAELAAMMPKAGGQYVFLREAYGPLFGFLFGWAVFLVIQTGTIAAVAVAFAKFTGVLFPAIAPAAYLVAPIHLGGGYAISLSSEQFLAVLMILLLTWSNTRGLELGKLVQNSFTFAKTAALFGLIVVGLALGWGATSAARSAAWWDSSANGWLPQVAQPGMVATGGFALMMLLGKAMVGPLFAQSAWNNVTFTAGEVRDPGRALPRALLIGCGVVVTLYLLANVAYIAALPLEGIQRAPQNRVAVAAMNAMLGPIGTVLMAIAIMISTFGCNNGLILAGARVYYAMARDGLFFRSVAKLNRAQSSGDGALRAGDLGVASHPAAHGRDRSRDGCGQLWKCLHAAARIHHLGRFGFLRFDGGRGDRAAAETAGSAATVSDVGLSDRARDLHYASGFAHRGPSGPGAADLRDRLSPGADGRAGIPHLAEAGGEYAERGRHPRVILSREDG